MVSSQEDSKLKQLRYWAGALSICAGAVHGIVAPEHLEEWWGYGTFFLLSAMAQVIYGIIIIAQPWSYDEKGHFRTDVARYSRPVYLAGAGFNLFIVLLYLITRTIGVPFFGPEAGEIEPVSTISLVSKFIEIVLIGVLILLLRQEKN